MGVHRDKPVVTGREPQELWEKMSNKMLLFLLY